MEMRIRVVLFCLLWSTTAFSAAPAPPKKTHRAQKPAVAPAPKVTVTSTLAEDTVRKESRVYFTGTIVNDGTLPVTGISILAAPPDTVHFIQQLPLTGTQGCDGPQAQKPLDDLPAGGRESFCGTLTADESHPVRRVTLVVSYKINGSTYSLTTSPGAFAAQDWYDYWVVAKLYNLLKDLGFPIFLALFGLILKLITDQRELRAETWKEMLPKSHDLAGAYYMPLAGDALGITVEWKRYLDNPAEQAQAARQIYYYILNFGRAMRDLRYALGGFYFKDRIGEQIAGRCWKQIRDEYFPTKDELHKLHYFGALRLVEEKQDVDLFLAKLDAAGPASPLHQTWDEFQILIANNTRFQEMVNWFDVFRAVVVYESNRVYAYWYRLPETLRLDGNQETMIDGLFTGVEDKQRAKTYLELSKNGQ